MKKILTLLPFILFTIISNSQSSLLVNDKLHIDSLYENKDEYLIISKVLEFEGLKKDELKTKVKNWGSTKFVNLKEVLISETDDQIVFNYIDNSFYWSGNFGITMSMSWYIRLVIQFKEGKIRCSYYDDGNVYTPYVSRGTNRLKTYFIEENGIMYSNKRTIKGLIKLKESIIYNLNSLKEGILKKDTSKDW
jgi:hypothetical protein